MEIRVQRNHAASPHMPSVSYVNAPPRREPPRPRYFPDDDRFLNPENERVIVRTRSRSRDRRLSSPSAQLAPPPPPPPQNHQPPPPVIITNSIYNNSDLDSDSEYESHSRISRHRRARSASHRRRSVSSSRSDSRNRDRFALEQVRIDNERKQFERDVEGRRRDYELERAQQELHELKLASQIEREEKRRDRTAREEHELREAKRELDEIQHARQREEEERRIKQKRYVWVTCFMAATFPLIHDLETDLIIVRACL